MNILTQPSLGSIFFNPDTAGSSTVSLSTYPKLQYDGAGGIGITSTSTATSATNKFLVDSANRLFTVTDALTGEIFSVTNYLGLPLAEIYSTATQTIITMGPYGSSAFVLSGNNLGLGTAAPNERLTISGNVSVTGGLSLAYTSKTSNYTATLNDYTIHALSAITITLPSAIGITGKLYNIVNGHTSAITVSAYQTQLINGANTATLNNQYEAITVQATSLSSWIIL